MRFAAAHPAPGRSARSAPARLNPALNPLRLARDQAKLTNAAATNAPRPYVIRLDLPGVEDVKDSHRPTTGAGALQRADRGAFIKRGVPCVFHPRLSHIVPRPGRSASAARAPDVLANVVTKPSDRG